MAAEYKGRKIIKTKLGFVVDGSVYETLNDATDAIDWA